jgi:hypothetical protein
VLILRLQVRNRRRTERGNALRLIQDQLSDADFGKNLANPSNQFTAPANHRFEFEKRRQLFIRAHNETLSVATMCVNNPDPFARENQSLTRSPRSISVYSDCRR